MLDRKLVQEFWVGIVETLSTSNEMSNRLVFPLLDAHPELANVRFRDYEAGSQGNDPGYAIHQAVYYGNLELTERLIVLGADVNVKGPFGIAPLFRGRRGHRCPELSPRDASGPRGRPQEPIR